MLYVAIVTFFVVLNLLSLVSSKLTDLNIDPLFWSGANIAIAFLSLFIVRSSVSKLQLTNAKLADELKEQKLRLSEELEHKQVAYEENTKLLQMQIDTLESEKIVLQDELQQLRSQITSRGDADSEVVELLSQLQRQGRLLDFALNDITAYPNEKVGAVARLVHQGCSKVLKDYFDIHPVMSEKEGNIVDVSDTQQASLEWTGKVLEEIESRGRLLHRGWLTKKVALPKRKISSELSKQLIVPAELEVLKA